MKKIQFAVSLITTFIIIAFIFHSCEDSDICTDEGEVPRMVASMYYDGTDVALEDTVYYWAYILDTISVNRTSDTVQIENGLINNQSRFGIAVRQNINKKIFYTVAQGPDRIVRDPNNNNQIIDTIFAKRDRLILEYEEVGNAYTSKACGFGLTFKNVKVSLITGQNGRGNWIRRIENVNTEIKNGSTTTIKLFTNERY